MIRRRALLERLVRGGSLRSGSSGVVYTTPERVRRAASRMPHLVMATLLMLALHAFWWFWLSPSKPEPAFRPSIPAAIRYASPSVGPDRPSVRIWSPVLSALPTPVGFSDFAVSDETGVGPALRVPQGAIRFLERPTYADPVPPLTTEAGGPSWDGDDAVVFADTSVMDGIPATQFEGLRLLVTDGLTRGELATIEIPGDLSQSSDGVWEAAAWLDFDDAGSVSHVFLERGTEDVERNRDLVRSLYQWKLQPEVTARRGRVRIHHFRMLEQVDVENGVAP